MILVKRFIQVLLLLQLTACVAPEENKLISIQEDALQFQDGGQYDLPPADSSRAVIFLVAYPPTRERAQLESESQALLHLFRDARMGEIYILERPTARELIRPLIEATGLTVQTFPSSSGADVLDRLLLEATGQPIMILASTATREAMITAHIAPDWEGWRTGSEDEMAVVVFHPNAGIQLMKFPF